LKNNNLILLITIVVSYSAYSSVDKLYLESLKKSKQVEIFELSEKGTLANLDATTSTLLPTVDLVNTNRYGNNAFNAFSDENGVDTQTSVSLEQRLFQGGAEFALYDFKKVIPKQAKALKDKNLSEYYGQFSLLYFQVSSAMEENEKVEALLKNLKKRVVIVKKRTKIGRDRKADLYALESQLYRLEADLYTSKALLDTSRTEFLNFSGLESINGIQDRVNPLNLTLKKNVDLEKRPELKNLKYNYDSSVLEAKIEKSSYYPQVDFGANYFLDKSRLGRNDWEVSLNVRLNILDFGQRSSNVQSKRVAASINKARFDFNRQNAKSQWSNFIDSFQSKKNELKSLRAALKRSRISYKEQLKDLNRGLVTQIDVIRSLDDVINLEKLSIRSSLEVKSLYYQANAYLGNFPRS
jgi:outer membrane protein TolC